MTTLKKRILSGMFALTLGFAIASPGRALADDWHHWGHDEWPEHHDGDRDDWRWRDRGDWYRPLPRNGEARGIQTSTGPAIPRVIIATGRRVSVVAASRLDRVPNNNAPPKSVGRSRRLLAPRPGAEEFLQPTLIIVVARHAFDEIRRGNLNLSGR